MEGWRKGRRAGSERGRVARDGEEWRGKVGERRGGSRENGERRGVVGWGRKGGEGTKERSGQESGECCQMELMHCLVLNTLGVSHHALLHHQLPVNTECKQEDRVRYGLACSLSLLHAKWDSG